MWPKTYDLCGLKIRLVWPKCCWIHKWQHMSLIQTLVYFVSFRQQIWPPREILVSDWLMLKKSSPLKLLGQMEPNLAGSIYVRSSIKFLCFVPFGQQIWLPRAILASDWLMISKSSLMKLLGQIKPNLAGSIYRCRSVSQLL